MRRLISALPVAIAATPAFAELPPDVWFSPCSDPVATCVRPAATHTEQASCGGCSSQPASMSEPRRLHPIADETREILDRWEEASRAFYPVTEAERLRLLVERPELTGQQLELVCALKQPIRANDLARRYDWATLNTRGHIVSLAAVPKDRLERLFYDRFVIDIDRSTGCPAGLQFGSTSTSGGTAQSMIAMRPWLDQSRLDIQLVGFESAGESPRMIRTADASDASPPMRPHERKPLMPPPAPRPFDCVEP